MELSASFNQSILPKLSREEVKEKCKRYFHFGRLTHQCTDGTTYKENLVVTVARIVSWVVGWIFAGMFYLLSSKSNDKANINATSVIPGSATTTPHTSANKVKGASAWFYAKPEEIKKALEEINQDYKTRKHDSYTLSFEENKDGSLSYTLNNCGASYDTKPKIFFGDYVGKHEDKACNLCHDSATNTRPTRIAKFEDKGNCELIASLSNRPLVVPQRQPDAKKAPSEHWFAATLEEQVNLIEAAQEVFHKLNLPDSEKKGVKLALHIGSNGGQTERHTHLRFDGIHWRGKDWSSNF